MARQQVPFSFVPRFPIPTWERQLIRGGVWDIRTSPGSLPVIALAGILILIVVGLISDGELWPVPFFCILFFIPGFVNSGLVLDRERQEVWLWRQILFWRRAWYVPPEDWLSMRVEYGRRDTYTLLFSGDKMRSVFENWSVFVCLPGKEYTAMAGEKDMAVEYAEAMGAFLSGKDLGKPPRLGDLQDKDAMMFYSGPAAIMVSILVQLV